MRREDLVDLNAFMAVAEERSFTRAAARLNTSQSALSHTIRRLETRLGADLNLTADDLTRISVALEAIDVEGERYPEQLMATVGR